jgi:hypothetical protein
MKNLLLLSIFLAGLLFGCDDSQSDQPGGNLLTIDGVTQNLTLQSEVNIYYNGGGLSVNPADGSYWSTFTMVNIFDTNQVFLPVFQSSGITSSFQLRFITHPQTIDGSHRTVAPTLQPAAEDIVAEYSANGQDWVQAAPGQTIKTTKSQDRTSIRFSNLNFGPKVISGNFRIMF